MKKKIINIIEILLVIILLVSLYRIYNYNKERNLVSGEMPDKINHIITLQTCSPGDTRLVVQGVLVED
ncbi:hypothetical protein [Peptoniphilus sp. DNF00840]|uniref:hypothetical protein n=1 Tax=Peptoniphilus sp. DNF00840 TaxID=1477000 RepID=UPI000781E392|nr:hypothetical protein [Peptoniphilus sp. DNF00840]KXB68648.1 hypothetical protein HMPREF1864_01610 [Peptoniphilus sp. DNF00840]